MHLDSHKTHTHTHEHTLPSLTHRQTSSLSSFPKDERKKDAKKEILPKWKKESQIAAVDEPVYMRSWRIPYPYF